MERRLAAILAADVVGFSRLIGADEEGTLRMLGACRELIDELVVTHRGRIFGGAGDSVIAEFASPVEAVRCALKIQYECHLRNQDLADDRRMEFRIGINLGDVVVEGDNLFGDGVNVAARLEALAEPGSIYVSDEVHRHVKDKLEHGLVDLGEQHLKNIARPVRVFRILLDSEEGKSRSAGVSPITQTNRPAVAVLPFSNMSADPEQEYFSDGLTEDIITALTHWRSFPVIARNSCFAYKNKTVDIKQASRELGARYLLEGSVRKGGSRVRITAQLIDGSNGHHIWAERYDRELDDIFEVQDEIVQRIAAIVAPELTKAELERSTTTRPEDLGAWDLYLRGMALVRERSAEGNAGARELFNRAIRMRPDYSDAYSGLSMSYNQDQLLEAGEENRVTIARMAMEAALKAVQCDEASAWAHHELSTAYQWLNRLDDALDEARISVDLNPYDAYGAHALGNKSDLAGDPEGIQLMEDAQKLNPADARLHSHLTFLARAYVNIGDHAAAADRARQAIRRRPDYAPAHFILAIALGYLGDIDGAREALKRCDELSPGFVASRRNWRPYADPASNARLHEGLNRVEHQATA